MGTDVTYVYDADIELKLSVIPMWMYDALCCMSWLSLSWTIQGSDI